MKEIIMNVKLSYLVEKHSVYDNTHAHRVQKTLDKLYDVE